MVLMELRILQALIILFLAVPLLRFHVKVMRPLDGLAWLPFVTLALLIGIIPAYGFRLECFPITVYAFICCIVRLIKAVFSGGRKSRRRRQNRWPVTVLMFIPLVAVSLPMFIFFPKASGERADARGVESVWMPETEDGINYFLRIYNAGVHILEHQTDELSDVKTQTINPVIFLIPPELGSAASLDLICMTLQEKGFTVITYFRKGFDTPIINENGKKRLTSPSKIFSYRRIFSRASRFVSYNERGKELEKERRRDIEFLLSNLPAIKEKLSGGGSVFSPETPVLLVGYGAGGSALVYFLGSGFLSSSDRKSVV